MRDAPDRETVKAYLLTFSAEGAAFVLADLERFVDAVGRDKYDAEKRMDPLKLAAGDAAREFLRRINSMRTMDKNPEWQAIERQRQMRQAQQKET